MINQFPECLGFAPIVSISDNEALYQVNENFKFQVKLLDDVFYINEYHHGEMVKCSKGMSLEEAVVNHFRRYDPLNCPFQEAWISKVTSIPFVYADYITKEDMDDVYFPQLFNVIVSVPFSKEKESVALEIVEKVHRLEIGICKIDECLHITVYPENRVQTKIMVLGIRIAVINVLPLLQHCSSKGLILQEKRFRVIVNRPKGLKSSRVRIFQGGRGDDWGMYMICLEGEVDN